MGEEKLIWQGMNHRATYDIKPIERPENPHDKGLQYTIYLYQYKTLLLKTAFFVMQHEKDVQGLIDECFHLLVARQGSMNSQFSKESNEILKLYHAGTTE